MIDRDIIRSKALVIDGNPMSRSILAAQLRDLGVGTVMQTGRLPDARRLLESTEFDVVLCEQTFDDTPVSGQDLLDDLRKAQLLPYATVFIMVTAQATYAQVAEAAESALDSYLVKPHTAAGLADRLKHARHRKKTLKDIFAAIDRNDLALAARLCMQRFAAKKEFWMYAGRIGAELLLRLGKPTNARMLYEAIFEQRPMPWAKLGIARAQLEAGKLQEATETLEALTREQPDFADAQDVVGRLRVAQGQLPQALLAYRQAANLTPHSIGRLQRCGMLAFYLGEHAEAGKLLDRAALIGTRSKAFDQQSLVLLSFSRLAQRDTKGLQRCIDDLAAASEQAPENARIRRFLAVARTLGLMLAHQMADVVDELRAMANEFRQPDMDIEAAGNYLALLARVCTTELKLADADEWVEAIGMRFCTSAAVSELLASACRSHPPHEQRIRACHARITDWVDAAPGHSADGDLRAAVSTLLAHADKTLNTRLIDAARQILTHDTAAIPDLDALTARADGLAQTLGECIVVPPLGKVAARESGAVTLRLKQSPASPQESPARATEPA